MQCIEATDLPYGVSDPLHVVLAIHKPVGGGQMHYGLTGGWVQKFKASYLLCFLHSALMFKARGQCDHHAFPLA